MYNDNGFVGMVVGGGKQNIKQNFIRTHGIEKFPNAFVTAYSITMRRSSR